MIPIRLVCLDLAGTTVADGGVVERSFVEALLETGVEPGSPEMAAALARLRSAMGRSKLEVFRELFEGDDRRAHEANAHFEAAYHASVRRGEVTALPGAVETVTALRRAGMLVCFTTGFATVTRDELLASLGWTELADLALSPEDAGRGRPFPDMILTAVLRLQVDDVRAVAVAGDTANDLLAGTRAGASVVAGVLTGAHDRAELEAAPHTHILPTVADLLPVVLRSQCHH